MTSLKEQAQQLIDRFRDASSPETDEPADEIDPESLTSPGTVSDPQLERRRAVEAAERERESRQSPVTKFEELRREEEAALHEHTPRLADPS
jgi:hypothetical protein